MKITELDLRVEGKKYFCKDVNEVFKVKYGNLIASRKSYCMADLLKMDFEEIKETKNPYERVSFGERYYFVNGRGEVDYIKDSNDYIDDEQFIHANYFNNKNYAEYVGFKENLMRKLDKFAWEHNVKVINWCDSSSKYYITFDIDNKEFRISRRMSYQSNDIYFTSFEIAEKAIEEFKDDLIKLYTWKFDF